MMKVTENLSSSEYVIRCLGTLMRMHDKEEKMPRLGPVCLIGCCLWVKGLHIVIKLQFFTSTFAALSGKFILQC